MRLQDTFAWRIGRSEKTQALEQLRYTIIGSQLLNDRGAVNTSGRRPTLPHISLPSYSDHKEDDTLVQYTTNGVLLTVCSAFVCASAIWWATRTPHGKLSNTRVAFVSLFLATICLLVYGFSARQHRAYARKYAIHTASSMINNAQSFDSSAHAASSLIQEVELVSRGFRLSSPLPPASRVEDNQSQSRRCTRLRRTLRSALDVMTRPHVEAYRSLCPFANEVDLDRYFDLYELSRTDIGEIEEACNKGLENIEELESIRQLKVDLHRLFTARKMLLCAILALDAELKSKSLDWTMLTEIMDRISHLSADATSPIEKILDEEEQFPIPTTPKSPLSPGRERLQHQIRKFSSLSQGIRGLQAKMHILREDSDKALGSSDEVSSLGSSLLEQYDAFGADLRALIADWEEGRSALTASIGKHERRISLNSNGMLFSRSPTPSSWGGITEVGSPTEALKVLNGDAMSKLDAPSSDEEILEAMASPRARSILSREERLAKLREDRARQASVREKVDASRFMVQELETVIKARPKAKTATRVTSI